MKHHFSIEETQLLSCYDKGSKAQLITAIENGLMFVGNQPDLESIMKSTLEKLQQMTEDEFAAQPFGD